MLRWIVLQYPEGDRCADSVQCLLTVLAPFGDARTVLRVA
jgi:hypothetical protein